MIDEINEEALISPETKLRCLKITTMKRCQILDPGWQMLNIECEMLSFECWK